MNLRPTKRCLAASSLRLLAAVAAGSVEPALAMPPAPPPLDAVVTAALADAAQRSGLPASALRVERAEAVTWRDGSLGCPQSGMAYTQALVPGYRVRILAGGTVMDYHAGRSGAPRWCPPGQAQAPLPDDARR